MKEQKKKIGIKDNLAHPNPRHLYRDKGRDAVAAVMQLKGGYVPQEKPLTYLCNNLWDCSALLYEGERGTGKTAAAEAVAEGFNLKKFELNCNSKTGNEDMLGDWNQSLQQFYSSELRAEGHDLASISPQIFTREFFNFGVVLEAIDYSVKAKKPCVLLLDEVDKLDERAEDVLLQLLARGYTSIARMKPDPVIGFHNSTRSDKFDAFPIIIATSNNMRGGLSSPFRSRFNCAFLKPPTHIEMIEIILTRVPEFASEEFLPVFLELIRFIDSVRLLSLKERPALREFLNFAGRIVHGRKPVKTFDKQFIDDNLDCLAKTENDSETFENRLDGLIYDALQKNKQLTFGVGRNDPFFTAEELVSFLFNRRYQLETNFNQFIPVQIYEEKSVVA